MFTGIVRWMGTVSQVQRNRLGVDHAGQVEGLREGDSIAVNGCCLTAVALDARSFTADVVDETLSRTTLGALRVGSRVNLERPLKMGDSLDGHLVQGHVDGVATVLSVAPQASGTRVRIDLPAPLARLIATKGSVAVDGVSLTVAEVVEDSAWFEVALIPETLMATVAGQYTAGTIVNLEVDLLARYLARLAEFA